MITMSKEYWIKRAAARMTEYVGDSERTANIIGGAYREASAYFSDEAKRILSGFERSFGLTQAEAKQVLNNAPAKSVIKTLRKAASQTTDPEKLARLNAMISSPAYRWRIDRLEKLSQEISKKCHKLYNIEVKKGNKSLLDTARKAYRMSAKDTAAMGGIESSWTEFPEESIREILKNGWNGKNYSQRVWHNRQGLGPALRQELLTDLLTGRDPNIAAHNLAERFNVSISDARRLMRTETNFISNQAELQQLRDMGAKQYEFCAALDERTSELCRSLNGKIFNIDEAVAGVNLPPIHPYCRSVILYVAEEEEYDDDELWSDEEFNSRIDEILKKLDAIEEAAKPKKKAGKGEKGVDKSGESGIIESEVKNASGQTVKIVEHSRLHSKPNSIEQTENKKGGVNRNYYDENGAQSKQISNNDHGNPKMHNYGKNGEHAHDYVYDDDGNLIDRPSRELNDDERKENSDIL